MKKKNIPPVMSAMGGRQKYIRTHESVYYKKKEKPHVRAVIKNETKLTKLGKSKKAFDSTIRNAKLQIDRLAFSNFCEGERGKER